MERVDAQRRETEALITAIWGPQAVQPPPPPGATARTAQNRALARALKAYLDRYLAETTAGEA